ncbi:MAG TPA: acetyl-CoA carboxylase biotin carboxylase subunit [Xanthobacteraceae bacterium]|nr:acetyl-CoA carboxylase biotin carboxylase subunit [Xanthobacteraceae bacterium]
MTISRVLIANRGEIALRVIRACQELGIETVLATSEADRDSLPARIADRAICIGPARSTDSYLNQSALITVATGVGADALHPGYGFLSENPGLPDACKEAGIRFVGPSSDHMRQMGNKIQARLIAREAGVPTLPGSEKIKTAAEAVEVAERVGFPVMLKAAAGGGGRGMKVVTEPGALPQTFMAASAEAGSAFGDPSLYIERFIPNARHIEVQVLGDRFGHVIHIGERDCSLQRRHQKVVEEAPAPALPEALREEIRAAAVLLARNIGYENAGTVEFIYDEDEKRFYFLEMNTRIQVEHPVSETITGIDLVQEQFRIADGQELRFAQSDVVFRGHAIECRINAEVPEEGFRPNAGLIETWDPPVGPNIRLDTHCYAGYQVPIFYDSMLAKLIVYGSTREEAIQRMQRSLERFTVRGVRTTIPFLRFMMQNEDFRRGAVTTHLIDDALPQFQKYWEASK